MALYITDSKKLTVREYCTTPKIEKAVETLLYECEDIASSETHGGYTVATVSFDHEIIPGEVYSELRLKAMALDRIQKEIGEYKEEILLSNRDAYKAVSHCADIVNNALDKTNERE